MPSAEKGRREDPLALRHAVALGLLQGPAELLPISSSAHTTLAPWLASWPYAELDGELRKSFEVALHAGAALALAILMRRDLAREASRMDARRALTLALSVGPPALVGFALRGPIERRLGGPRSIALCLAGGGVAMALADRHGDARGGDGRTFADVGPSDGLALGLAQMAALMPGVSRNGATLAAARMRGFTRGDAQALSWHAGLPVLFAASALKGWRLRRSGVSRERRAALAAGGAGAFLSTLAGARALRGPLREGHSLAPYALYRCGLAALVVVRLAGRAQ